MRKIVKKAFWAWESEKEEQWLNEMAAKGLALVDYSWCRYSFEECEPGEYTFGIQLLEHKPSHPESESYIRFIEETGAEQVASYMNWVYFRKKNDGSPMELFSDIDSKLRQYILIKKLLLPLAWFNLFVAVMNIINCVLNYLPGIWIALLNVACFVFIALGIHEINKKIKKLKKERTIME